MTWTFNLTERPTQFTIGALGGGGFSSGFFFSPDGQTFMSRTDIAGAYIYDFGNTKWQQILRPDNVPIAHRELGPNNGNGLGCNEMAVAPSNSQRIYLIVPTNAYTAELWRSDDRALSFTTMQTNINIDAGPERLTGPKMCVDPNNEDVVYWSNQAGIWFRSLDGAATIYDSGPIAGLLSALQSANTTASTTTTTLTFAATPSRMTDFDSANLNQSRCCYNYTRPASKGHGPGIPFCSAASATTVTMQAVPEAQIQSGDTIYFGSAGIIQFDPDGGTTTFAGATVTKNIFFSWVWGATAIWKTTNGGSSFSSMAGSPIGSNRMACSDDGVLYVCGHTPTAVNAVEPQNMWRYVGASAPGGSGLSTDTWTNLSPSGASANHFCSVAYDPNTPGKVSIALASGNLMTSSDWGETFHQTSAHGSSRLGGDVLWLTNTPGASFNLADICYDVNDGKLWGAHGVGVWTTTPPLTDTRAVWATATLDINSLIIDRIVKVPDGGPVLLSVQDRALMVMPDSDTAPNNNGPADAIFTGSISENILTVSTMLNGGTIIPNASSSSVTTMDVPQVVPSNSMILAQLTGSTGGTGTYQLYSPSEDYDGISVSSRTFYYINGAIRHSFDCTFAAQDPSVIFGNMGDGLFKCTDIANEIWIRSDGWNGGIYPTIAAQTALNFVGIPINQQGFLSQERSVPRYTTDGGATANICDFGANWPYDPMAGWNTQFTLMKIIVPDRVNEDVYYCYNTSIEGVVEVTLNTAGSGYTAGHIVVLNPGSAVGSCLERTSIKILTVNGGGAITGFEIYLIGAFNDGAPFPATMAHESVYESDGATTGTGSGAVFNIVDTASPGGLYRSADGGATWTKRSGLLFVGTANNGYAAGLHSMPGHEGHLIRSDGVLGFDNDRLMRWVESEDAWFQVQGDIDKAYVVAVGAPKPGRSFPSVFMYGKCNGDTIPGVYRCDDMTTDPEAETTWLLLTNFPGDTVDTITGMAADEDVWGDPYVAFSTTGYYKGSIA